jgi:uncharacterized protein YcbX
MRVGTIGEVWRYPVKSLGGERLHGHVAVGAAGIEGDRAFAVVDDGSGKVLSAKRVPALFEAGATWLGAGRVRINGPGFDVTNGDDDVDATLSGWLGRPVHLATPQPEQRAVFEMEVDPDDASEVVDLRTPPGRFFDSRSCLHVLTTASLAAGAKLHPAGDWDARRFRPNVVVDLTDEGFPEDGWVDGHLRLGGVTGHVRKRTSRCVMTARAQPGLGHDSRIYRSLLEARDGDLGVYVDPTEAGTLAAGDAVEVEER